MGGTSKPEGYEIPVHRSLTVPLLMGGVPREVMILNATMTAALIFGLGTLWVLPFTLVVHLGFVTACRHDPKIVEVGKRHIWQKSKLEV